MIKILYLHGGAEMYGSDKVMFDLICNLDKSKYEPYVILPKDGILVDYLKKENIKVDIIPYPILRRKYFNLKGIFNYCINFIKYSHKLKKIAKEQNIDIIHNNTSAVFEGSYISKKLNIPQIWVVHEIIKEPKIIHKFIGKIISLYSTYTIAVSNAVKQNLIKTGYFKNKKIDVIYNGVDISRFNPNNNSDYLRKEWNIPKNANIIGMMGRINAVKGQHDLLNAANIVMKKNPNLYTIFVGDAYDGETWREEKLLEAINGSPFKDRIIFQGFRKDSEYIHSLFDIYILPSVKPDSFPTVVLEAMATGKAVIGYSQGGIGEMVDNGNNGYLVDIGNYKLLAKKIDSLLNNKSLLKNMGKEGYKKVTNNFSLKTYVKNYSFVYDNILNKK